MPNLTEEQIYEADSEQLDKMLDEVTETSPDEDTQSADNEETQSADNEDTSSEVDEDAGEDKEEPSLEERLKELEEANKKFLKRLKDKDNFIERRNAEIGELRKKIRERELSELPDDIDIESDEFFENPKEAVNKLLEAKKKKAEILERIKAEQQQQQITQMKKLITEVDPDFEDRVPDIISILKEDGAPENIIRQFEEKPYASFNPAVTLQLIKRASLTKRVKELEDKLKEAQDKPSKLINNVQKYSRNKSKVTNSAPASKKPKNSLEGLTEKDVYNMSLEELEELEKTLTK